MLNKSDLKEIEKLLDPIKESVNSNTEELKIVKEDLKIVKEDLKEVKETVTANNSSLIKLENNIGGYKDALDVERKRIDKHDDRLEVIEESLESNL